MKCPVCGGKATGKVGFDQYYCWDCSIEFVPTADGFRMYRLEPDGTTVLDSIEATGAPRELLGGMLTGSVIDGELPGETEDMNAAGENPEPRGKDPA